MHFLVRLNIYSTIGVGLRGGRGRGRGRGWGEGEGEGGEGEGEVFKYQITARKIYFWDVLILPDYLAQQEGKTSTVCTFNEQAARKYLL